MYQVVADGLPTEFPVLRSVDHFAGNLPAAAQLARRSRSSWSTDVAELVRSDRLVTLCGVGGVGKTRLAIEVGAELAGEFPDGVWIVELAAVGDAAAVPAAIATVLGITPQGDVPLLDTVADAARRPAHAAGRRQLRARRGAARRAPSRRCCAAPGTSGSLATSREPLGVAGRDRS